MKNLLHILSFLLLVPLAFLYGCETKTAKDADNSNFSVEFIHNISIAEPERALALLDSAEQNYLISDLDISRLRSLVYHNGLSNYKLACHYGMIAYHIPEVRSDAREFLLLLEQLADDNYNNGEYAKSVELCTEGLKIARDSLLKVSEANLQVSLANNLLEMNLYNEAFEHFRTAIDILDTESRESPNYAETDDYIYALGMIVNALCDEKHYSEALEYIPRYAEAISRLDGKAEKPEGLCDMRLASGYAAFSYILKRNGNSEKADQLYDKLLNTEYVKTPEGEQMRVPYLLVSKRYHEALHLLQREKEYWKENADTVSYDYIEGHLKRELEAYEGLGDIRSTNRLLKTIQALADTLRIRDRHEDVLEFSEIYKTQTQALEIGRQKSSIIIRNIIIVFAAIFLLLAIFFIVRILQYNRIINKKNGAMVRTIDELMGYKYEAFERQEEIIQLQRTLQDMKKIPEHNFLTEQPETVIMEVPSTTEAAPAFSNTDHVLFVRMNHEILARRLFLISNFSKKDLMTEFKIPANKFSMMFKNFAGCSFSQYIQNCRIDYAVKLMRENPQWSLESIAKEAQMSNGAFYSHFRRRFGMSPSDFRSEDMSISTKE